MSCLWSSSVMIQRVLVFLSLVLSSCSSTERLTRTSQLECLTSSSLTSVSPSSSSQRCDREQPQPSGPAEWGDNSSRTFCSIKNQTFPYQCIFSSHICDCATTPTIQLLNGHLDKKDGFDVSILNVSASISASLNTWSYIQALFDSAS